MLILLRHYHRRFKLNNRIHGPGEVSLSLAAVDGGAFISHSSSPDLKAGGGLVDLQFCCTAR